MSLCAFNEPRWGLVTTKVVDVVLKFVVQRVQKNAKCLDSS